MTHRGSRPRKAVFVVLLALGVMLSFTSAPHAQDPGLEPKLVGSVLIPEAGTVGGELRIGTNNPPGTFHPYINFNAVPGIAHGALLETNPITLEIENSMASSFTISSDRSQVTLTIRPGIQWSDGELVDAGDVLFTYSAVLGNPDRVTALNNAGAGGIGLPSYEVTALDDRTVQFTLSDTSADVFLPNLAGFSLLPEHALSGLSDEDFIASYAITDDPNSFVGAGPYVFSSIELDNSGEQPQVTRVELTRNPNYWKVDSSFQQLPYLDQVTQISFPDDATLNDRLGNGEIDLLGTFGADAAVNLVSLPGVNLTVGDDVIGISSVIINQDIADPELQQLFRDDRFRLAIAQSINRDELVNLQPEHAQYISGTDTFVHPRSPFLDPSATANLAFDLAHARALLNAIGIVDNDGDGIREFESGNPVSFVFNTNDNNSVRVQGGQRMSEIWRNELGLDVEFLAEPFGNLQARFDFANRNADFDVMFVAFGLGFITVQDPSYLNCVFTSAGFCHVHRFSDPEGASERQLRLDAIFGELAAIGLSLTERISLEQELQRLMAEDLGHIPVIRNRVITATTEDIQNTQSIGLPGQGASFQYLWRE